MVKLVSAKCPNCGGSLKISKEEENVQCEYCQQTIIIDDAIACYKLKISGTISIEGIQTNSDLIDAANELLDMKEYLKAKRKFLEFTEKCPNNYQGWLGLLICRTRNFTIRDNNILFENDVNKFYEHFLKVAPDNIKKQYINVIENYLHPNTEQQIKNILNKNKKTSDFHINPKYKPYILPIILLFFSLSLLSNSSIIGGLLWMASGIILLPKIKNTLNWSKKKRIIISVILFFFGFIAFAIESPYGFEGNWATNANEYYIELKNDQTYEIKTNSGKIITGTYSHIYQNELYIITIESDNTEFYQTTYAYSNNLKKLCIYENKKCTSYLKQIEE